MSLSAGTRLGAYEIVAPVGKGGMGEVYRAKDSRLGRDVAIKVLPVHLAQNAEALRRFEREARTLAALSHPNILTIFDVGTEQSVSFAVMELLEGETLRSRIGRSALSWEKALQIAVPIAEGLAAAHSKRVIHRDLKPENVFLTSDGRVKILDFGLARYKPTISQDKLTELPTQSRVTESGVVMGTVPYMSPEQVRGESVDARTDIFSFGCLLYEMITARRAFSGNTSAEVVAAILRDEPAKLPASAKEISPELDHVITHCLEKSPEKRFQSARDLAFELQEILSTSGVSRSVPAAAIRSPLRRTSLWIAAAFLVLVALMIGLDVGGLRERLRGKPELGPIDSLAVLPLKNLSGDPNQEYFADGMTEELIAKLARIESLRVISRTSVMEYKAKHKSLPQIAKELNVDVIVEGSVLQAGDRVRITAQLIYAATDRHLWAESYERDLRDIFALQNEVASDIAREIKVKLRPQEQAHLNRAPQVRPDAYQAYLRGLDLMQRVFLTSEPEYKLAAKMFERAVELDPNFAVAYANLSIADSLMYWDFFDRTEERLAKAKEAVDRAFQLELDSAEAHIALGYYYYWGYLDYDRALHEFAVAQRDLPGDKRLFSIMGAIRRRQGRFEEAVDLMKKSFEIDPRDGGIPKDVCYTYMRMRKYSEAEHYCDVSISLLPDQLYAYTGEARIYFMLGATRKARAVLEKVPNQSLPNMVWCGAWLELYERNYQAALNRLPSALSEFFSEDFVFMPWVELQGLIYYLKGEQQRARSSFESARLLLEKKAKLQPGDYRVHSSLGITYAGLGHKEEAIREAKLAVELHPTSKDTLGGPWPEEWLAQTYVMVGEYDAAVDRLEFLLSIPSQVSVPLLRIDPRWDPLRNHPRFQKLLQKYS